VSNTHLLQFDARQEGNPEDRVVRFIGTTSAVDRHGSRLVMSGMRAEAYRQNPVVSFNHLEGDSDPDVAVIGRSLGEEVFPDRIEVLVEFEPDNPTADKVLRKVLNGYLRGMSITCMPITEHTEGELQVIDEWDLWSWSIVPIPSNPGALKRSALEEDMDQALMEKLGLKEGASFEDAVAALLTYLAGTEDSKEDRQKAVDAVMALKKDPEAPEEKSAEDKPEKADKEDKADAKSEDKPADKAEDKSAPEMRSALDALRGEVAKLNERIAGIESRSADADKVAKTAFYRSRLGSAPEKRAAAPNFGPKPDDAEADPVRKSVAETMAHITNQMLERAPRRVRAGAQ